MFAIRLCEVGIRQSRQRETVGLTQDHQDRLWPRLRKLPLPFRGTERNLGDRISWAKELGLKQMIISTFSLPQTAGMHDWETAAGEASKLGEQVRKAGMQLGLHNHNFEFKKIDGALIYDKLMGFLDPELVKMQFQVEVISQGFEAATFLTKYPGR